MESISVTISENTLYATTDLAPIEPWREGRQQNLVPV